MPYIKRWAGETIVVKYGGNAMINPELKEAVMNDIVLMQLVGVNVVLVHGGGPEISGMLKKIGKEGKFLNGMRVTDQETMDIVQQVLAGKVNKDLVQRLEDAGGKAIGLCGLDGALFEARVKNPKYGLVGEICKVNPGIIYNCLENGYIPVVSTVGYGVDAECSYNINADTAAAELAIALGSENLILLTDVRGLLRDPKDESTLIPLLPIDGVPALKQDGTISGGMIPKVDCCVRAIEQGVQRTFILDGRIPHSILIEMLTNQGIGTMLL